MSSKPLPLALLVMALVACGRGQPMGGDAPSLAHSAPSAGPAAVASAVASAMPASAPGAGYVPGAVGPTGVLLDGPGHDARFIAEIRPLLLARGCAAGSCHGAFKGGGFEVNGELLTERDLTAVVALIRRDAPDESLLLRKGTGAIDHSGGKNLDPEGCDVARIRAWIADAPSVTCPPDPPARSPQRFAREVAPALASLGCATGSCHSARSRLDFSAEPARAAASLEASGLNSYVPWTSPVIRAAWGELPGHHRVDLAGCAFERLFRYVTGAPESRCSLDKPRVGPSLADLSRVVMPALQRRGCLDTSCHGGGGSGQISLFDPQSEPHAAVVDSLALLARVADPTHLEQSTLLRTLRNEIPHGGGKRLGGEGDCLDGIVRAWVQGRPVRPCKPRAAPPFATFASEIQPVLDRMTCSQWVCHGQEVRSFRLIERAEGQALRSNYESVLRELDLEYMPFSGVMLRMREPCAYAVVGAWIEGKPRPACPLKDPDPAIFPRLGTPAHPPPG